MTYYVSITVPIARIWHLSDIFTDLLPQLRRYLHQGGIRQTQQIVSKIIRMTIETGILTGIYFLLICFYIHTWSWEHILLAAVSIVSLTLFYIPKLQGYYEVPLASLAKVYSTTLLVVLNSRAKLGIISESTTWKDVEIVPIAFNKDTPMPTHIHMSNTSIASMSPMEFLPGDEPKANRNSNDWFKLIYYILHTFKNRNKPKLKGSSFCFRCWMRAPTG